MEDQHAAAGRGPASGASSPAHSQGGERPRLDAPSHMPPQSVEAEEAILGAMLMSQSAIEIAMDMRLRERDFYRTSHRTIFRVILQLAERDAVDELTVINELKHQNVLQDAGGSAAIMTLAERVPAVANARAYAQEVINQATLRALVESGHEIARLGYEHPEEPDKLVDQAGGIVSDLAHARSAGDFLDAAQLLGPIYDELAERAEKGEVANGLMTGFFDFDKRTGGLRPGNLVIVAGRPGMGKTSWAMNVAENIVTETDQEGGIAIFSLEMTPQDLMTRMMCSVAKVNQQRVRNGIPEEQDWPHLVSAVGKLNQPDRLFISEARELTPMTLRAQCRRLARQLKDKGGLRLVIIDYIGLMDGGRRGDDGSNRTNEITYISRQLKSLALELELPIIALSQLNRSVENRQPPRPNLSDLRDSGAIEQDADMVLFLYRPEYYSKEETPVEWQAKAELIVAKHRNGQPGSAVFGFLGPYTKFVNLAHEDVSAARDNRPGRGGSAASIAAAAGSSPSSGGAATVAPPAPAPADAGSFGDGRPADMFGGEDFGLPAPPPDAYGDVT
ncbi:MAG: primary replicative helicase [Thermoleophilia bacterium]|nr:primary replicative helicase [Thermoleophilia bacterium]